ncbi:MAG TPA: metalloregulator ArsR/SmtB family transcription factor [Gammaproteobacteria bacterium]|nr:metalloregulator ArsR/SmtB family transcription factor [Gammaproteobacteria bacterium]
MSRRAAAGVLMPAKFSPQEMGRHAQEATALLHAMASEHRLMVLCSLVPGERTVSQLLEKVPLTQSALSQHLAVLRHEGLVSTRREGQAVHYALEPGPALEIIRVLYENFCCEPRSRGG